VFSPEPRLYPVGDSSVAIGKLSDDRAAATTSTSSRRIVLGNCRQLSGTLDDGTTHLANPRFK
jgi:hypothetical protein